MFGCEAYVAQADILNERRVQLRLLQRLLQQRVNYVVKLRVLESTLDSLGQGRSQSKGNHDIIWVFLGAIQALE